MSEWTSMVPPGPSIRFVYCQLLGNPLQMFQVHIKLMSSCSSLYVLIECITVVFVTYSNEVVTSFSIGYLIFYDVWCKDFDSNCTAFISVQQKTEDLSMYLKLLSFLDTPALIVAAAAANDASTVRDFLSRKPQDVRKMMYLCVYVVYTLIFSPGWFQGWKQNGNSCSMRQWQRGCVKSFIGI